MKLVAVFALAALAEGGWVKQEPDVRPYESKHSMWVLEKSVPADHSISMTVALKVDPDRRAKLEQTFWEVSDPKHEKYGQHLKIDDITKLLAIPDERVAA